VASCLGNKGLIILLKRLLEYIVIEGAPWLFVIGGLKYY